MRSHRTILAQALKAKGLTHVKVAKLMGYKSPATVGHKLRGIRDWDTGELAKMAEIAGMSLVVLAEKSDDLHVARRPEAVEGAAILDEMDESDLGPIMAQLRAYRDKKADR